MPDIQPRYRFRGSVEPCAEVSRPVTVRRNAATTGTDGSTSTSATLDIFDVIDSWGGWWGISARDVDRALKQAGDVDTLYVRVNSPGGEATEGVAIANLLRAHSASIHVTVFGLAASAASYISTAGDVVTMAPGSMMMVHDAWNIALGSADELRAEAVVLDKLSDSVASLYALKAGGTAAEWRAVMRAETWYTAEETVAAKLADKVGLETTPDPVNADDVDAELEALVEAMAGQDSATALAARAAARFDLSMFAHAPAALAAGRPQAPAADADGSITHERSAAVAFTDEQLTTMRQQLGLPNDADESAIVAAQTEALAERADPPAADPPAAAIPEGSVVVSQAVLDELRLAARDGQEARAVQLRQDRDDTINAAINSGHISPARRAHWVAQWDADAEGTRAAIATLTDGEPLFPVGPTTGVAGHDGSAGDAVFTDDQADALAQRAGVSKEALVR